MKNILKNLRWLFTGIKDFLPFLPIFFWSALKKISSSTVDYWKGSQQIVEELSDSYNAQAMQKMTSEYSRHVFWACYVLASFLYLLGWIAMSWLTVEAVRLLISVIF